MSLGLNRHTRAARLAKPGAGTSFSKLSEGVVSLRPPQSSTAIACGSRCAATTTGEVVCTFMGQTSIGLNDFCPIIARSADGGVTWHEQGPLWPRLRERYSIFGSVSAVSSGELFFYGMRTPIDVAGEPAWCEATQGLKANNLVWARSNDHGHTWTEPAVIPMPFAGSAEAPGPLCVARDGTWHVCYAPYNTFDPALVVPRNQVVLLSSSDEGKSWRHTSMMRFADELFTAAEAWVVELADGRLLGTCWNMNQRDGSDFPNAFAISHDGGKTWMPTQSTGIMGQASALAAMPDGSALFVYNQRKHGEVGVWLAHARPSDDAFNVLSNQIVWRAPAAPTKNDHGEWTQFTFGEPSVTILDDQSLLISFWSLEQGVGAIRYVKLSQHRNVPAPLGLVTKDS